MELEIIWEEICQISNQNKIRAINQIILKISKNILTFSINQAQSTCYKHRSCHKQN